MLKKDDWMEIKALLERGMYKKDIAKELVVHPMTIRRAGAHLLRVGRNTWDEKGDNIFVWDFFELETEGGHYLKTEYARSPSDWHPNSAFAAVAHCFIKSMVDVIEGRGDT